MGRPLPNPPKKGSSPTKIPSTTYPTNQKAGKSKSIKRKFKNEGRPLPTPPLKRIQTGTNRSQRVQDPKTKNPKTQPNQIKKL